jgi:uncharacterized protein (TIGR03000 family)
MRRALLVLSLVGLTMVASAGDANAQRRGDGGYWGNAPFYSGGWGSGGYYPQAGYYSSYYYGGRGYSPYYQGYGYGYPAEYYNTVPNYAANPGLYYSQPAVQTQPTRVYQSFYSEPPQQFVAMTVVVPTATAQVWFENTLTTQQGTERLFRSPALEPGKNFTYTIKARWMENGTAVERDRQVNVQAGQKITVNFRNSPGETAPAPAAAPSN